MRYVITAILFLLIGSTASAQQVPQYTQYQFNHFGINPALAGIKECLDMRLGYRRQWLGLEGAPRTAFVNVHGRLPTSKNRPLSQSHHGIGGMVESDETGPTSRTILKLAYAYHMRLRGKTWASAGVFAGIQQYRFDISEITVPDYNDPALSSSSSVLVIPDISPGIWIYNDDYYGGLVLRQAFTKSINPIGVDSRLTNHWMIEAGKKWGRAHEPMSYIPSILVKFGPWGTPAVDLNLLVDYGNRIQFGGTWRNTDAVAAMFKVKFMRYLALGYSFDFTTSRLRVGSSNTHEIMLGIYSCPRSNHAYPPCQPFN
jgi:type IX secretion system PorP/SprF family membrane protein